MGSLERRVERLEERRGIRKRAEPSEEELKRQWLEKARYRRRFDLNDWDPYGRVRDIIRVLRRQGRMGTTTQELRAQLLAWRPPHDAEAIEREVSRFIYAGEEGTENMVCPPKWREALEAGGRLRELYASVPAETLARWAVWQHELEEGEGDANVIEKRAAEAEEYGITDETMWKAVGPDAEEISDEERRGHLLEILAESYYGERGWRVQQEIHRLMEERTRHERSVE